MTNDTNPTNSSQETPHQSNFIKMLLSDGGLDLPCDLDSLYRLKYMEEQMAWRSGYTNIVGAAKHVSYQFVAQQAFERYCIMVNWALSRLRFTAPELVVILNTTCGPYWQWHLNDSVAGMVADDNGISTLESTPEGSLMREILEKLMKLDQLENVALVDFCERFWRTRSQDGFQETCLRLGLTIE